MDSNEKRKRTDKDPDFDIVAIARDEGQRVLDAQNETLNNIDAKASRVLRLNLIILSILLSGFSVATSIVKADSTPLYYSQLVNFYTTLGVVLLLFSTALAGVVYTQSNLRIGIGSDDLRRYLSNDVSGRKNTQAIVKGYANWIEYNTKVNAKNAPLATATILLLIGAMIALALSVKKVVTGSVEWWLDTLALTTFFAMIYLTAFINQLRRYNRMRNQ